MAPTRCWKHHFPDTTTPGTLFSRAVEAFDLWFSRYHARSSRAWYLQGLEEWRTTAAECGSAMHLRGRRSPFTITTRPRTSIRNCFITCHLLIETTVGRVPKFISIDYFGGHLVTIALLTELYPMVLRSILFISSTSKGFSPPVSYVRPHHPDPALRRLLLSRLRHLTVCALVYAGAIHSVQGSAEDDGPTEDINTLGARDDG